MDTGAGVYAVLAKTLSKLISLSDDRFQELIDDGTINPKMGCNDMSEPQSEQEELRGPSASPRYKKGLYRQALKPLSVPSVLLGTDGHQVTDSGKAAAPREWGRGSGPSPSTRVQRLLRARGHGC